MECPYCNHKETKVTNKRDSSEGRVRRRRECLKCTNRFTTYEIIHVTDMYVLKKDGTRQRFEREKLARSIRLALEKRPFDEEKIESIIDSLELSIRKKGKEIKSSAIGSAILGKLKRLDKIAYIRFASVYKAFEDPKEFELLIEK